MSYLKGKNVYLAGAISGLVDNGETWRNYLTPILESKYGLKVEDPCKQTLQGVGEVGADKLYFKKLIKERKYEQVKKEFYKIIRKDLKMVDRSDFIIVNFDPTVPTIGTVHEIVNSVNMKKVVLVFCEESKVDSLNPWLLTLIKPQWLFTSWDSMFKYLDVINSGDLDTSHWW